MTSLSQRIWGPSARPPTFVLSVTGIYKTKVGGHSAIVFMPTFCEEPLIGAAVSVPTALPQRGNLQMESLFLWLALEVWSLSHRGCSRMFGGILSLSKIIKQRREWRNFAYCSLLRLELCAWVWHHSWMLLGFLWRRCDSAVEPGIFWLHF